MPYTMPNNSGDDPRMDTAATASVSEKDQPAVEHTEHPNSSASEVPVVMFGADSATLPRGYFSSPYFLGSMAACGMSLLGSVGGYALAAPILGIINADIGPDKNIAWVPLMFPVGLAVGQTLLGRVSDIFGRRWFFAGGQGFGLVGAIICARAKDVPTLIGGSVIVGLAGATALSYPFLIGELVPMKYRFFGTAYACFCCIPFSGLAPAIANSLATTASWRWCYYIMIIFNGLSMTFYILFYHPPTFGMKHSRKEKLRMIRSFDYVGIGLFTSGMVCECESHPPVSVFHGQFTVSVAIR
jgi:MFS family permease